MFNRDEVIKMLITWGAFLIAMLILTTLFGCSACGCGSAPTPYVLPLSGDTLITDGGIGFG